MFFILIHRRAGCFEQEIGETLIVLGVDIPLVVAVLSIVKGFGMAKDYLYFVERDTVSVDMAWMTVVLKW